MHPDQPLSDKEFNELDQFLLSDRCADEAMTMDALHGYLTALVIGPDTVPTEEWLPQVWGPEPEHAPKFRSDQEAKRIRNLILRFRNEIALTFELAPKEYEPLFLQHQWQGRIVLDAEAWAWGFWVGMDLRAEAWAPAWDSPIGPLLETIYLLGAEEIEEEQVPLVDDPGKRHQLALQLEAGIPLIHRYWQAQRKPAPSEREQPRTGRNELCGCGSGRKFKKCCGAAPKPQ